MVSLVVLVATEALAVTAATMATLVKVDMAALVVLAARAVFY